MSSRGHGIRSLPDRAKGHVSRIDVQMEDYRPPDAAHAAFRYARTGCGYPHATIRGRPWPLASRSPADAGPTRCAVDRANVGASTP